MRYNERTVQRTKRLCQKWHQIQHQLLIETDADKKQYWIYQETVLERRFDRMANALLNKTISRSYVKNDITKKK